MTYRAVLSVFRPNTNGAVGLSTDVEAVSFDEAGQEAAAIITSMISDTPSLRWPKWVAEIALFSPDGVGPVLCHVRNNQEDRDGDAETITHDQYYSLRRGGAMGE